MVENSPKIFWGFYLSHHFYYSISEVGLEGYR
uniref:Uncharacterized protein n=2 Tax=unclassified Caudoviricetes TaxID=2788787 RepID=A0A8S5LUA3_9CAUD|nr:MAG TPA: hypothetical protein [Siphoviridae sp. ctKm44]DAE09924.1 MAG TPA: hypothetical protein [Siphoviridae sp. ctJdE31]